MLRTPWYETNPLESADSARDRRNVPGTMVVDGSSEIMLKRMPDGTTQTFTIREWVGWDTTCNAWDADCSYTNMMHTYAIVGHPLSANGHYSHAWDGDNCHGKTPMKPRASTAKRPTPRTMPTPNPVCSCTPGRRPTTAQLSAFRTCGASARPRQPQVASEPGPVNTTTTSGVVLHKFSANRDRVIWSG